jgi:flagellar biosynthesis GTPase FlhF
VAYFERWYTMLEHEFRAERQFEAGELVFWREAEELERTTGLTVANLTLLLVEEPPAGYMEEKEYTGEEFVLYEFVREEVQQKEQQHGRQLMLKENDMVLLSCTTTGVIGLSQGFIRAITNNSSHFTLLLDKRNLSCRSGGGGGESDQNLLLHYRIDKIHFRSAITLNYTNVARLMGVGERNALLRSFIVDKRAPTFDKCLPKQHILQNKAIFRQLNQSQQAAIIRALMAHHYLLVKGYPGTGKTTTIAALIAILVNLGKRVLFTAFTNSAVDNLLLKVKKNVNKNKKFN